MMEIATRFWRKVKRGSASECWPWTHSQSKEGYGRFMRDRKARRAHRIAWELTHGAIPAGLCVLHRCDNPPCVNPAHLWLGTHADNRADSVAKGRDARGDRSGSRLHPERLARGDRNGLRLHPERVPRGERAARAKLTEQAVREIRALAVIARQKDIATMFGVSRQAIYKVIHRRRWQHVS